MRGWRRQLLRHRLLRRHCCRNRDSRLANACEWCSGPRCLSSCMLHEFMHGAGMLAVLFWYMLARRTAPCSYHAAPVLQPVLQPVCLGSAADCDVYRFVRRARKWAPRSESQPDLSYTSATHKRTPPAPQPGSFPTLPGARGRGQGGSGRHSLTSAGNTRWNGSVPANVTLLRKPGSLSALAGQAGVNVK